jgi:hypothetical protein
VFICLRPRTPEKRLEGQQFTIQGRKYLHDQLYTRNSPMNSEKHLPQSLFTGQFFLDDDIFLAFSESYLSTLDPF